MLISATAYCAYKYIDLRDVPESSGTPEFTANLDYYLNLTYTWLALGKHSNAITTCSIQNVEATVFVCLSTGIFCAIVLLVVLILVIFLRKRILIAVELIKEASR